jgi:hypothetical protein
MTNNLNNYRLQVTYSLGLEDIDNILIKGFDIVIEASDINNNIGKYEGKMNSLIDYLKTSQLSLKIVSIIPDNNINILKENILTKASNRVDYQLNKLKYQLSSDIQMLFNTFNLNIKESPFIIGLGDVFKTVWYSIRLTLLADTNMYITKQFPPDDALLYMFMIKNDIIHVDLSGISNSKVIMGFNFLDDYPRIYQGKSRTCWLVSTTMAVQWYGYDEGLYDVWRKGTGLGYVAFTRMCYEDNYDFSSEIQGFSAGLNFYGSLSNLILEKYDLNGWTYTTSIDRTLGITEGYTDKVWHYINDYDWKTSIEIQIDNGRPILIAGGHYDQDDTYCMEEPEEGHQMTIIGYLEYLDNNGKSQYKVLIRNSWLNPLEIWDLEEYKTWIREGQVIFTKPPGGLAIC